MGGMCIVRARTIRGLVIMAFVFLVLPVMIIVFIVPVLPGVVIVLIFLVTLYSYLTVQRPEMDRADMVFSPTVTLERYWAIWVGTQKSVHHAWIYAHLGSQ
jgi:hypothetical protein